MRFLQSSWYVVDRTEHQSADNGVHGFALNNPQILSRCDREPLKRQVVVVGQALGQVLVVRVAAYHLASGGEVLEIRPRAAANFQNTEGFAPGSLEL